MVLAKSAKIMPVIIVGMIRRVYEPNMVSLLLSTMITTGLILFSSNKLQNMETENLIGTLLVVMSLVFDGFVSS